MILKYSHNRRDNRISSLPCKGCGSPVETSAFNAEAPTEPAGETVGCRRQLGGIVRLILYAFVKSLSHFLFPKNDSSLYKGAFGGQGRALSLRYVLIFLCDFSHKLSYIINNQRRQQAAALPCGTLFALHSPLSTLHSLRSVIISLSQHYIQQRHKQFLVCTV